MNQYSLKMLLLALGLLVAACNEVESSSDGSVEYGQTSAYFAPDLENPERSLLPLPNILALNRDDSPPTLNIKSSQCYSPGSLSEVTLDGIEQLNGFGTYSSGTIMAFFGDELDEESLEGRVILLDLGPYGSDWQDSGLQDPIPVAVQMTQTPKFLEGCQAEAVMVDTMIIIPMEAATGRPVILKGNHQYAVALLDGIRDSSGLKVVPFYIWAMVRSAEAQSDLSLIELQYIHKPVIEALLAMEYQREQILLAWTFNTQYTDTALTDISARLGILGDEFDSTAVTIPADSIPVPPLPAQNFLGAIGLSCDAIGAGPDCPGISLLLSGQFSSPRFQQAAHLPHPFKVIDGQAGWVPGAFNSTTSPSVQGSRGDTISFLASLPAAAEGPVPVVIFQHPLTPTDPAQAEKANKMAMLGLANTLGAAGMAVVAIDGVLAGDRSIMVHNPIYDIDQLYPVLNSDVFVTRDNIRQTVVDLMQLVRVLKDCTVDTCGGLEIDPEKIYFLGTSLGSVSGSLFMALTQDVKRAVFNVPGAGLADILATSPILSAQLVPVLCGGGILTSACCSDIPPSCTVEDLAADSGFAQFKATAQWILDPGDPVNYAARLANTETPVFIQQATGDKVFANPTTALLADLLGLTEGVDFKTYSPGVCADVPGGAHSMLLQNCGSGTAQMQADIVTFLTNP
jgi:hypothetical protein